jgi:chromosome segregation ATPase
MKVQDLFETLNEARQPQWAYTEKRVKGALDKVILALDGSDSGVITRLAKRYERLDKSAKLLKEKRDEVNTAIKDLGDRIFDAEDAVASRIIETVSYTVMLTAAEKAEQKKPTAKIDFESAYSELAKLIPELTEKVDEIRAKYTEMIQPTDTPVKLRVKTKVQEGLLDMVKAMWSKFMASIGQWARSYDSKLDAIKAKFPVKGGNK